MVEYETSLLNAIAVQLNLQYWYQEETMLQFLHALTYKLDVSALYEFCYSMMQNQGLSLELLSVYPGDVYKQHNEFEIKVFNIVFGQSMYQENINIYKSVLRTLNFLFVEIQKDIFHMLQSLTTDILIQLPQQVIELDIVQLINLQIVLTHFISYKTNQLQNNKSKDQSNNVIQNKYKQIVLERQDSFSESHLDDDFNDTSFSIGENDESTQNNSTTLKSKFMRRGSGLLRLNGLSKKEYSNYNDILSIISKDYANCSTITQFIELLEPLLSLYDKLKYKKISINQFKNIDCRATIKLEQILRNIFIGVTANLFDGENSISNIKLPIIDNNLFDQDSLSSYSSISIHTPAYKNDPDMQQSTIVDDKFYKVQSKQSLTESSVKQLSPLRIQQQYVDQLTLSEDDEDSSSSSDQQQYNILINDEAQPHEEINRQYSYQIDSKLSFYDNDVYFNDIKELLKIIDLVEYYIKDPRDDRYAGMYFINYIHCAFTNIYSITSLVKNYIKRPVVVNQYEAQLLGNCMILNKLDINRFMWVDKIQQWQQENQQLSRNQKYQLGEDDNYHQNSLQSESDHEKYLEQLQINFQLAVSLYLQNQKKK